HFVGGGVQDQRKNQDRQDVVVYTSDALTDDMELTGPVTVTLFVSTSAVDTDFMVYLSDVRPDGYAQNLVESLVRGRFRNSYSVPESMEPGSTYEVHLDLWNVSHVLRVGHRLRVHVS